MSIYNLFKCFHNTLGIVLCKYIQINQHKFNLRLKTWKIKHCVMCLLAWFRKMHIWVNDIMDMKTPPDHYFPKNRKWVGHMEMNLKQCAWNVKLQFMNSKNVEPFTIKNVLLEPLWSFEVWKSRSSLISINIMPPFELQLQC